MQSPANSGSERTLVSSQRQIGRTKSGIHIIFDVGMNNGDDSAHYLSKGYQVVAIEANPILVERARARFQKEIAASSISLGKSRFGSMMKETYLALSTAPEPAEMG